MDGNSETQKNKTCVYPKIKGIVFHHVKMAGETILACLIRVIR